MDPFVDSGRALSISIRYEPNNTGLVRGSILGCVHPDTELRIPYLAAERHLPNCWLRYLHLGRWHLQLRGLIPFPSIGTHRRLANLDSLVNNHAAGLFGVDLSCSRWTELVGLGRSPRSHRSSTSGALLRWCSTRICSGLGAHLAGLHST